MSHKSSGPGELVAEATEIVEALARDVSTLDQHRGQEVEPDLVNGIFRAAHSLKGVASMFGQDELAHLAHAAEELLDRLRLGKAELSDAVVDALLESVDGMHALLSDVAHGSTEPATLERARQIAERLQAVAGPSADAGADPLDELDLEPEVRAVLTEYEEHRLRENVKKGVALYKIRAAFDLSDFDQKLAQLNERLKPLGEVISTLPSAQPGDGTGIAFDLVFGAKRPRVEIDRAIEGLSATLTELNRRGQKPAPVAEVRPARSERKKRRGAKGPRIVERPEKPEERTEPAPPPRARQEIEPSLRSLTQTVRVDIRKLDALMNAVGELLLIKANVQRLADSAQQAGAVAISRLWGQELARESRQLERRLEELQKGILEVRMVPLGQVFDKLARLVRRVARENGKEIDFVVSGGEVELDKLIVEELSDPLMHIIRNSIDHGIEPPDERVALGKSRRGVVTLEALQKGNHVVIEISDDGRGLDEQRIKSVAVQKGLVTAEQAREMSRREIQNLIFLPGFSTAQTVSELSGRGVGLDVVKTNLANMSGIIDVASEPNEGTTLTLTLPVTLAIIRALMVGVSGRVYALPLSSVMEIVSIVPEQIRTIERREVVTVRGQTLPFMPLARLFGLPESKLGRHFVVVVGLAQNRVGLAVDELLGQQDIVIKPLGGRLRHIPGVAGATDLGNRRTVLVLDVGALMEEIVKSERFAEPA